MSVIFQDRSFLWIFFTHVIELNSTFSSLCFLRTQNHNRWVSILSLSLTGPLFSTTTHHETVLGILGLISGLRSCDICTYHFTRITCGSWRSCWSYLTIESLWRTISYYYVILKISWSFHYVTQILAKSNTLYGHLPRWHKFQVLDISRFSHFLEVDYCERMVLHPQCTVNTPFTN